MHLHVQFVATVCARQFSAAVRRVLSHVALARPAVGRPRVVRVRVIYMIRSATHLTRATWILLVTRPSILY